MIDGKLHWLPLNVFVLSFLNPVLLRFNWDDGFVLHGQEVLRLYANNKEVRLQIWVATAFVKFFLIY